MKPSLLPVLLLLLLAGCATRPGAARPEPADVLEVEEIRELPATSAYEVVRRLRPQWLQPRTSPSLRSGQRSLPVVYVDGIRRGDPSVLRRLRRDDVVRIEYLRPADATNRYGTNHGGGAILVTTG